ncbi:DNA polymerase III subunit chi [Rickettsiales bacterium Ac37b]|nr:DNA polymerase III subunit chi [Rickettsiales bacterium Ac37b]
MTEISFYHLTVLQLERALPRLLEKVVATRKKAILLSPTEEQMNILNDLLWTYSTKVFLPHGTKKEGFINKQPIYLTSEEENPNNAEILITTYGIKPKFLSSFTRCIDIFNGNDEEELENAKLRIAEYQKQGHNIIYWQQTQNGTWEQNNNYNFA